MLQTEEASWNTVKISSCGRRFFVAFDSMNTCIFMQQHVFYVVCNILQVLYYE